MATIIVFPINENRDDLNGRGFPRAENAKPNSVVRIVDRQRDIAVVLALYATADAHHSAIGLIDGPTPQPVSRCHVFSDLP